MHENALMRREGETQDPTAGGNLYEGERDAQGHRHGRGKFTFADGAVYEGDWLHGLRHGVGEFKYKDGSVYKGQWQHDLKHGQGKFWFSNGDITLGVWTHDRLNGLARLWTKGQGNPEDVIYKDDMLIKVASGGLSCAEQCYVIFSVLFLCAFYAGIFTGVFVDEQMFGICSVIMFYWIWSCCTSSTKYIMHTTNIDQVFRNVDAAIASPPTCTMRIECYHYEWHTIRERDNEGRETTRTERRRVTTWTNSEQFRFSHWMDRSPPSHTLSYLDCLNLVRLRTYKNIDYSPQAMTSYLF